MSMGNHELIEEVRSFATVPGEGVRVTFRLAPAHYRLAPDAEGFLDSVVALAGGWQRKEPVKVRVRGTDILSVSIL